MARTYERYKLVLYHDMVFGDAVDRIDDPIAVEYIVDRTFGVGPIIVNEMCDRLKDFLLKKIASREG